MQITSQYVQCHGNKKKQYHLAEACNITVMAHLANF